MSQVIVIAGPNGSGKTTSAPALLQDSVNVDDFVNADTIAQGLSAFQPDKVAIQAGRVMLKRIDELSLAKANFAFETTLASRTFAPKIQDLKKQGYQFHLIFLWLNSPDLAILRVRERIKMGGHSVPEETIQRRYNSGLNNFFNLYKPLADSWQIYNNSGSPLSLIASTDNDGQLTVKDAGIWTHLQEIYYEQQI